MSKIMNYRSKSAEEAAQIMSPEHLKGYPDQVIFPLFEK